MIVLYEIFFLFPDFLPDLISFSVGNPIYRLFEIRIHHNRFVQLSDGSVFNIVHMVADGGHTVFHPAKAGEETDDQHHKIVLFQIFLRPSF